MHKIRLGRHDYMMVQSLVFSGLLSSNQSTDVNNAIGLGDRFVAALEARMQTREAEDEAEDEARGLAEHFAAKPAEGGGNV